MGLKENAKEQGENEYPDLDFDFGLPEEPPASSKGIDKLPTDKNWLQSSSEDDDVKDPQGVFQTNLKKKIEEEKKHWTEYETDHRQKDQEKVRQYINDCGAYDIEERERASFEGVCEGDEVDLMV